MGLAHPTRFERVTFAFGAIYCPSEKCDRARYSTISPCNLLNILNNRDIPIRKFALIFPRVLTQCLREKSGSERKKRVPKITKRFVDAAEAREKDYVVWDDELPGFGLRVFASGKRSYVIQYRAAGRSRRYTIGLHGGWTPETARQRSKDPVRPSGTRRPALPKNASSTTMPPPSKNSASSI